MRRRVAYFLRSLCAICVCFWSYDTYSCDATVCSYNMDALTLVGLAPRLEHVQTFTNQQMTRSAVLTTHASAS